MKVLQNWKMFWLILVILFAVASLSFAQDASQSSVQNDLHKDPFHIFKAGCAVNATDSLIVKRGGNDHTDPWVHWKNQVVHAYVVGVDSARFVVDHLQSGYSPSMTGADSGKFCMVQTLKWCNADSMEIDTIEALGHYIATLNTSMTDTSCTAALYDMLRTRPNSANAEDDGLHVIFTITQRDPVTLGETWRRK